jgi:heat shock protein HslJ
MKPLLLIVLLSLSMSACTRAPTAPAATPPADADTETPPQGTATAANATELGNYHWRLTSAADAEGKRIDTLFVRAEQPVQLDFAQGRLSISNTCNRMGGGYAIDGAQLKIEQLSSTLMACTDNALMTLDQEIGKRMEGTLSFAIEQANGKPQLTLTGGNGDVLIFTGHATAENRYGSVGEQVFLEVEAQTRPCSHPLIPDKQCLQVREIRYDDNGIKTGTPGEFQPLYEDIEGYRHQPGVRTVLRVKRFKRDPVPADASDSAYVLDMVVESEVVKP